MLRPQSPKWRCHSGSLRPRLVTPGSGHSLANVMRRPTSDASHMKLWTWTRRVVTDQTGGVEPVPVGIERNPMAAVEMGAANPPDVPLYVLRVGLRGGFGGTRAGLPAYRRENPAPHPVLKEIYQC